MAFFRFLFFFLSQNLLALHTTSSPAPGSGEALNNKYIILETESTIQAAVVVFVALFPFSVEISHATHLPLISAAQHWKRSFIFKKTAKMRGVNPLQKSSHTNVSETNVENFLP